MQRSIPEKTFLLALIAVLAVAFGWNVSRRQGRALLVSSVQSGDIALAKRLMNLGFSPKLTYELTNSEPRGAKRSLLYAAARRGDLAMTQELLRRGVKPDLYALEEAVAQNRLEVVKALLEAGANLTERPAPWFESRREPVQTAVELGNDALLRMLLEHGADPNFQAKYDGRTALMLAIEQQRDDLVQTLLEKGADINRFDFYHGNALSIAIQQERLPIIQTLAQNGADVNAPCVVGFTPLMSAAAQGSVEIVDYLLRRGANPSVRLSDGRSPLSLSVAFPRVQALLQKAGARP